MRKLKFILSLILIIELVSFYISVDVIATNNTPPEMPNGEQSQGGTPPTGNPPDGNPPTGNPPTGTPPEGNPPGDGQGNNSSTSLSYNGARTITSDANESGGTYSSTTGGENALIVNGAIATISSATFDKTGDSSDENSDFYGTNAGAIAIDGTLNIDNSKIRTNGLHANAIFAYGNGKVNISNSTINTSNNNSGGIMVTGGGTLAATNLNVTTEGNSSAAIRSDRGGGTLTVEGGTYTANGIGSPAIYSTANISVKNATLVATQSEGAIVEGKNTIKLENTNLTDSNTQLNGQSKTYKNIFLYQSMSGDADEGTAEFSSKDSTITTNNGDVFFITNTTANIDLENTKFVTNSDGVFLRIEASSWGNSGSNGGNVTLNAKNQTIEGNIVTDDISTLSMNLYNGSTYTGIINGDNSAKQISITLDKNSSMILNGDTYVYSLEDADESYSNITSNGYNLYVNGKVIQTNGTANTTTEDENESSKSKIALIAGIAIVLIICIIVAIALAKRKK